MTSFRGLPLESPIAPMLAKAADTIPEGEPDEWLYEPKWDGFRCIVFRSGDELELSSRNERPFNRYFPELFAPLLAQLPERCVVDGEIVVPDVDDRGLDFDALLQRIHPAESRVRRLAAETPASFVAFDLLALDDRSLMSAPLVERHALLDRALGAPAVPAGPDHTPAVHRCPSTRDAVVARRWFVEFEGAGLDGVVAKRLADPYTPDKRTLVKVKHLRTAECVVAGYRIHKDGQGVGSLLLGLHDDEGRLHHVGVTASFTAKRRAELLVELAPLLEGALDDHPWRDWAEAQAHAEGRLPGAQSRWNAKKDLSWVPIRAERVAEVTFGQLEKGRFRHGSSFLRWRPDRTPASCRYDQLEVANRVPFHDLVAAADG
ncbi:MAG: ATP-dependent DNA ligase [Acidimicrobiales bacterium]|nr:ATP-dependent DNA ligase [Acidimicrobiales bacterium]MCB9392700.1 ATP-dependent DNA ligase [Acidimicrobiaceae bacterium]